MFTPHTPPPHPDEHLIHESIQAANQHQRTASLLAVAMVVAIFVAGCGAESVESVPEDPREFAVFLVGKVAEEDWEAIRGLLTADFHSLDVAAVRRSIALDPVVWPQYDQPDQWRVEQMGDITLVRVTDAPSLALNLRPAHDGSWRLDPGPYALNWARIRHEAPERPEVDFPGFHVQTTLVTDESTIWITRRFRNSIEHTSVEEGRVVVTIEFTITGDVGACMSLDDLTWRSSQAEGRAEVVWTTAVLDNGTLCLPEDQGGGSPAYWVSLQAEEVPDVDTIEISLNNIRLDGRTLSLHYSEIPRGTYPRLSGS